MPDGPEVVCLAFLPPGVAESEREEVLGALDRIETALRAVGGKRYLSGWLGAMDEGRWREHLGVHHAAWVSAKRRFDPENIFCSVLLPGP